MLLSGYIISGLKPVKSHSHLALKSFLLPGSTALLAERSLD